MANHCARPGSQRHLRMASRFDTQIGLKVRRRASSPSQVSVVRHISRLTYIVTEFRSSREDSSSCLKAHASATRDFLQLFTVNESHLAMENEIVSANCI